MVKPSVDIAELRMGKIEEGFAGEMQERLGEKKGVKERERHTHTRTQRQTHTQRKRETETETERQREMGRKIIIQTIF